MGAASPSLPSYVSPSGPEPSISPAYPTDSKTNPFLLTLPILLPPLFAPSPSSPFLVGSSPSLPEALIPRLTFLAFVKAINESLHPSSVIRGARTAENVINSVPVFGLAYRVSKWAVAGLSLGIVKETVEKAEILLGESKKRGSAAIGKAQDAMYGTSATAIPKTTLELIEKANSPFGLFPPTSGLLLALVSYSMLPLILSHHAPLPTLPSSVVAQLVQSHNNATSSPEQKKARKIRARIDFRKWAWVSVEGEDENRRVDEVGSSKVEEVKKTNQQPPPLRASSASSSRGGGGLTFDYVDEKLAARNARRIKRVPPAAGVENAERWGGDAGFQADEAKVDQGTLFLVVMKRGLEGLEMLEGRGA